MTESHTPNADCDVLVSVTLECGHTRQLAAGIVRASESGHFRHSWCDHPDCECHRLIASDTTPAEKDVELALRILAPGDDDVTLGELRQEYGIGDSVTPPARCPEEAS